jgi:hypothetical protein
MREVEVKGLSEDNIDKRWIENAVWWPVLWYVCVARSARGTISENEMRAWIGSIFVSWRVEDGVGI